MKQHYKNEVLDQIDIRLANLWNRIKEADYENNIDLAGQLLAIHDELIDLKQSIMAVEDKYVGGKLIEA